MRRFWMLMVALGLVAAGCGRETASDSVDTSDWVEVTPEAIANIVADHTDLDIVSIEGGDPRRTGGVGVSIDFTFSDVQRGDEVEGSISLGVADAANQEAPEDEEPCPRPLSECADLDTPEGTVRLGWQTEAIESDPGLIIMDFETDGVVKSLYYYAEAITDDPRRLDLTVDVDQMVAILTDPRFGLTTPPELVSADASTEPGRAEPELRGAVGVGFDR